LIRGMRYGFHLNILKVFLVVSAVYSLSLSRSSDTVSILENSNPHGYVALTFDDGPSQIYTPQVLEILKENNIHATFFLIGKNVEKYPEIVKRIAAEGHTIGNHTYTHPTILPLISNQQLIQEIKKTENLIYAFTGKKTDLFRPPHGWRTPWMVNECEKLGYDLVNWTVDPKDWRHPSSNVIVKSVIHKTGNGAIVLLHDGLELKNDPGQENTLVALSQLIAYYRARNYTFVTIDQIIADKNRAQDFKAVTKVILEPKSTYH
jgi:peptidoglycan/xylan/chitin deacetylase (PgdA/CDA1 family)